MEKVFARSRYSRLVLSFLFVFVGPTERCGLENFGSPWCVVAMAVQTFQKKKTNETFKDVKWMLTITQVASECRDRAEPARLCCGTLADGHTDIGDKRVHEKRVPGIEVP
jgi:hypothetical protein